jgi:hypothetical protein
VRVLASVNVVDCGSITVLEDEHVFPVAILVALEEPKHVWMDPDAK